MEKKTVPNTSTESPMVAFASAVVLGPSNAILAQESQGQQALVNSDVLPTECSASDRAALEKAGVKFGEVVPSDPIFQYATLPAGWKKVGTDHAMHSLLVDDKGRERASIFYKAAFYDRHAHMTAQCFYRTERDKDFEKNPNVRHVVCADSEEPIATFDDAEYGEARQKAYRWLEENKPGWDNPSNYWTN